MNKGVINTKVLFIIVAIFFLCIVLFVFFQKNNEIEIGNNEIKNSELLIKGKDFNLKLKQILDDGKYESSSTIKYIGFYSNGRLPDGYTYERLMSLKNTSVSIEEGITAFIDDNRNVYIYSDDKIYANEDSSYMFYDFRNMENIDIDELDTSIVKDMSRFFSECRMLESLDLTNLQTSNVTYMQYMFEGLRSIKFLDLSNIDTSNVSNMSHMFSSCYSLENLNLKNFDTSKVKDMQYMFSSCDALKTLDLTSFDTSSVNTMKSMFNMDYNLKEIYVSEKWQIKNSTIIDNMFNNCGVNKVTIK